MIAHSCSYTPKKTYQNDHYLKPSYHMYIIYICHIHHIILFLNPMISPVVILLNQIKTMGYLWGTSRPPGDLVHVVASGAIELSDL